MTFNNDTILTSRRSLRHSLLKLLRSVIQLRAAFTELSFPISEERLIGLSGSELRWFWEEDERIEGERLAAFTV